MSPLHNFQIKSAQDFQVPNKASAPLSKVYNDEQERLRKVEEELQRINEICDSLIARNLTIQEDHRKKPKLQDCDAEWGEFHFED